MIRSRLPPGLDLSVYRIIQESLTNVVKHAHASRADVQIRCRPQSLDIDVPSLISTIPATGLIP